MQRWPFLLGLAALLFASHGAFLNDELDQASALWSLTHGSLEVQEYPRFIYMIGDTNLGNLARYDDRTEPVGSTLLNLLAVPVAAGLVLVDQVLPVWLVLSGLAVLALWKAGGLAWPWDRVGLDRAVCWAALVGALSLASTGFRGTSPDQSIYYVFTALQMLNLALWTCSGWLLWRLLKPHAREPARAVIVAGFLLGPVLFWGQAMKYHMLTATLTLVILWLRSRPRTMTTDVLLGATVAVLLWTNLGPGVAAILAVALVEIPRLFSSRGQRRKVLAQWGAILAGFMVGVTPFMAENTYLTGNPFLSAQLGGGEVKDQAGVQGTSNATDAGLWDVFLVSLRAVPGLVAHFLAWEGPKDFAADILSILTFGQRVENEPLGIFFVAPWLAASVLGLVALARRRVKAPEARLAAALVLGYVVFVTQAATKQGAGMDVRMWLGVQPAFALLAAIALAPMLDGLRDLRPVAWATAGFVAVAYLALALVVSLGYQLGPDKHQHAKAFLLVVNGTVVSAWLAAVAARPVTPQAARLVPILAGVAVLVPVLAWSCMFLWVAHTEVPAFDGHDGGGMFVPFMDGVTDALAEAVLWTGPLPIVYDGDGNLFFHPDYGRCDQDPNPCPEHLRRAAWATNSTLET